MVTMLSEELPEACPLCERPNFFPSDHHLIPKSRGGRITKTICKNCHGMIHATFSNKELEKEYHTVEALLAHPTIAKQVAFLRKQDPRRRYRMVRTKKRQRDRRYA
jgi:hypothetical protein